MDTRKQRAMQIRDTVLPWLRLHGHMHGTGDVRALAGNASPFIFVHRTFFCSPVLQPRPRNFREAASLQVHGGTNLPYGLDVWYNKSKVMNIEWDDAGLVHLVGFRSGVWEEALLRIIAED